MVAANITHIKQDLSLKQTIRKPEYKTCFLCIQWEGEVEIGIEHPEVWGWSRKTRKMASCCLYRPHKSCPTLTWQVRDTMCWPKDLSETCLWINIEHWESIGVLNDISNDALSLPCVCSLRPERAHSGTAVVCGQRHGSSCNPLWIKHSSQLCI